MCLGILRRAKERGKKLEPMLEEIITKRAEGDDMPIEISVDVPEPMIVEYQPTDSRIRLREDNCVQTLTARMGTGGNTQPLVLYEEEPRRAVLRKITPIECARLQGFPDEWCSDLETDHTTDKDISFWKNVWTNWNNMQGKKPKTERQIRTWLSKKPTDAAQYKMWGNGVALPCVEFIMQGIAKATKRRKRIANEGAF